MAIPIAKITHPRAQVTPLHEDVFACMVMKTTADQNTISRMLRIKFAL